RQICGVHTCRDLQDVVQFPESQFAGEAYPPPDGRAYSMERYASRRCPDRSEQGFDSLKKSQPVNQLDSSIRCNYTSCDGTRMTERVSTIDVRQRIGDLLN